jgi:predicted secreted Zn-dependent protease
MNPSRIVSARLACLCIVAFAGAAAAASVEPELDVREVRQEYYVSAANEAELRERLRIGRGNWTHARGLTQGRLTITRNVTQTRGRCIVNAVAIELEITTTLPEWDPAVEMPPELRERWETFRALIGAHEDRHRENLMEAAFAMRDQVAAMAPQDLCMKVEAQLKRIVDRGEMKRRFADHLLDRRL